MSALKEAYACLEQHFPELKAQLDKADYADLEKPNSEVVSWFKLAGGCSSLVKEKYGGMEMSAWQAVLLQMAIGAKSPSLAIAAGMHQFSIATLQEMAKSGTGLESLLLEAICKSQLLVSSAFSEGQISQSILESKIIAKPVDKGFKVSGVKKPCSLAHSMDLLTASVRVEPEEGDPYFGVALIHKNSEGVNVAPFWQASFLKASQSEAVHLDDVYVPQAMLVNIDESSAYQAHVSGFVWFELLTSASYLGMVYGLVDNIDKLGRLHGSLKSEIYIQLETSALALKAIALDMHAQTEDTLAQVLCTRYQLQTTLTQTVQKALSAVGGINYINQPYYSDIARIIHAFNFHPPAQHAMVEPLNAYFDGEPLTMV